MLIEIITHHEIKDLGQSIKEARKNSSKSITELAARAGMSASNWYRIESSQVLKLPISTLRAIEESLEVRFLKARDC
ncbi:helix-turn-helix domain-containing protein [Oscillatoriales cyanobacterium LEGE 11467]|uniref:Helix-turn-helix domain-containing protein n=1 Tax=Zarconia navalis LEGE 11467 TaxID=1828826 RepID=A0A928VY77_9CYAN|nr:helix-turn-helix domain-containing protein [Zarconia navalis LEGE 11467]